jgi:hypothetical protein
MNFNRIMKNAVFLDVAPYGSCKNRRFRGTCHLHLHDRKIYDKNQKCWTVANRLAYISITLYMEAIRPSETSVL